MPNSEQYAKRREYFLEYSEQYRAKHRENITEKNVHTKYDCECGGKYCLSHKARHEKSTKHLKCVSRTA